MILGAVIATGSIALVLVPAIAGATLLVAAGVATMRRTSGHRRGADEITGSVGPSDDRWRRFTAQIGQLDDDVDSERRPSYHDGAMPLPAFTPEVVAGSWAPSGIEREPVAHFNRPSGSSGHRFESTSTHHLEPGMTVRPVELPDDDWPSVLAQGEIGDTGPLAALPPSDDHEHRQAS